MNPIVIYRIYRFKRRCGFSVGLSIKIAIESALRP